jgi:CDP-6-deoxy-D-xylo-4-hexulose-3-dehydrase
MKTWKLNESNFSFSDRLKIASFFLNAKNFWTMNKKVSEFESEMKNYVGCKHAVFVSSGSTANTILAMYLKDKFHTKQKKKIIFPSTTWTTSISPFIREGFEPLFVDISLQNFAVDLDSLEETIKKHHKSLCAVFITSLIGFVPDMERISRISHKYKIKIMMDNCENTLGHFNKQNVSSFLTSTTSTYFGHQIQSVEGGFIFTNDEDEYDYFLMARNHGMTRSVKNNSKYLNPDVDSSFDFYFLGNNFRNTDINAFIGLLDFKRIKKLKKIRVSLYNYYLSNAKCAENLPRITEKYSHVPFCLPIFCENSEKKRQALKFCEQTGIETRPIISGNLLRQTCYKNYADFSKFKNSEYVHNYGFYVGLHSKVNKKNILKLTQFLNNL